MTVVTKEERNRRMRERRTALVITWVICFIVGMMVGLFVATMVNQARQAKRTAEPEQMQNVAQTVTRATESEAETREGVELKIHTREFWVGLKRTYERQDEAEPEVTIAVYFEPETVEPETVATPEPTPTPEPEPEWIKVLATAYVDSLNAVPTGCVNDLPLTDGWSVAAVLSHLPYGTIIEVEGMGLRRVEDTASKATIDYRLREAYARGCSTWIDIYMADAAAVDAYGVREIRIRVVG